MSWYLDFWVLPCLGYSHFRPKITTLSCQLDFGKWDVVFFTQQFHKQSIWFDIICGILLCVWGISRNLYISKIFNIHQARQVGQWGLTSIFKIQVISYGYGEITFGLDWLTQLISGVLYSELQLMIIIWVFWFHKGILCWNRTVCDEDVH